MIAVRHAPSFLTIGHVTRDLRPDGSFSLGGTVTFAALTAHHLGLVSAIVTCADTDLIEVLPDHLPDIALHIRTSEQTTTFANRYTDGFRVQYLHARSNELRVQDVPELWCDASIVLLGPLAQELNTEFVALFPRRPDAIIAATPQGWLRRWDDDGRVWPTPWETASQMLPLLDVLILSHDDLLPFANDSREEADLILVEWSKQIRLLIATDGRHGATLFRDGVPQRFPAYAANEVDPTGAGDVFAASFLVHYQQHGDPERAVDFANCVASFSVEQEGILGIPTSEMVEQRMHSSQRS